MLNKISLTVVTILFLQIASLEASYGEQISSETVLQEERAEGPTEQPNQASNAMQFQVQNNSSYFALLSHQQGNQQPASRQVTEEQSQNAHNNHIPAKKRVARKLEF